METICYNDDCSSILGNLNHAQLDFLLYHYTVIISCEGHVGCLNKQQLTKVLRSPSIGIILCLFMSPLVNTILFPEHIIIITP